MTAPTTIPEGLLTAASKLPDDPDFRSKVMIAVLFMARKTLASESDGGNLLRLAYARQVCQAPASFIESFAWTMAADENIAAQALKGPDGISDAMIFARVGVAWDFLVQPIGTSPV